MKVVEEVGVTAKGGLEEGGEATETAAEVAKVGLATRAGQGGLQGQASLSHPVQQAHPDH